MLNPLAHVHDLLVRVRCDLSERRTVGDPSGLESYALFLLCGLIPWNFFAAHVQPRVWVSINGNAGLVRRVAFPREILVFANVLHACVQFSIELSLMCLILSRCREPVDPVASGHVVGHHPARHVRFGFRARPGSARRLLP